MVPRSIPLIACLLCFVSCFVMLRCSVHAASKMINTKPCPIGKKPDAAAGCVHIDNDDIQRSLKYLASPLPHPTSSCGKKTVVQGMSVCEDYLDDAIAQNGECVIWSFVATSYCGHLGSLEFEKVWSTKCKVRLFHYTLYFKGNTCDNAEELKAWPNITITQHDIWAAKAYSSFYKLIEPSTMKSEVSVLKIQVREGVYEDFEGVPFTIFADLYLHKPDFYKFVKQIVYTAAISSETLIDSVGREGEFAWNMWATRKYLKDYGVIFTDRAKGVHQPLQYDAYLRECGIDPEYGEYRHTLLRIDRPEVVVENDIKMDSFVINRGPKPVANVPLFCAFPAYDGGKGLREMQRWIDEELLSRCHATRLHVPCERNVPYEAFIPCHQELIDDLAEDYMAMLGLCNFKSPHAAIPELTKVPPAAAKAFQVTEKPKVGVRLAFFFTIYADSKFISRLLDKLYSTDHYYLLHVDAGGAKPEFLKDMNALCDSKPAKNCFVVRDVPIVYGAATATIVLVKAMAWFLRYTKGWDYFVPVTGSDYPLVPLRRMEKMFAFQQPPMPFVMAWTPGTSTHIFRLSKMHPYFENSPHMQTGMTAVSDERGKVLGAVPMEYRSNNFGPPLFCNGKYSFYHLDNRRNKSGTIVDTQWLFPRDKYPGRGRAYADETPELAGALPYDKVFRVWKKSDPATTGAYDLESVEYIINSEEGRKYWHFFKHMLLGSEEHYFVSLLYNWNRTKMFVQNLGSQIVWNTWELGLWEQAGGFQTHTHFLTEKEWPIIKAFALRGMIFARKLSTKKTPQLIDMIDQYIHFNASTDAGIFWPGYFYVDMSSVGKKFVAAVRANTTGSQQERLAFAKWHKDALKRAIAYATDDPNFPTDAEKYVGSLWDGAQRTGTTETASVQQEDYVSTFARYVPGRGASSVGNAASAGVYGQRVSRGKHFG